MPEPATGIEVSPSSITLVETEEYELSASLTPEDSTDEIVWSVNPEGSEIVSVTPFGKITALKPGNATVTATAGTVSASCEVTVKAILLGDANDNGVVNVADVGTISDYIVSKPVFKFCFANADVVADKIINTADITATVNIIFDDAPDMNLRRALARKNHSTQDYMTAKPDSGNMLGITLTNAETYVGIQGSIILPQGVTVENITEGSGASNHLLNYNITEEGVLKFVLYSLQNDSFEGDDNNIMNISLSGMTNLEEMRIFDVIASDIEANQYDIDYSSSFNPGVVTSVGSIDSDAFNLYEATGGLCIENAENQEFNIFDTSGRKVKGGRILTAREYVSLSEGIYIVIINEKSTKVIIR